MCGFYAQQWELDDGGPGRSSEHLTFCYFFCSSQNLDFQPSFHRLLLQKLQDAVPGLMQKNQRAEDVTSRLYDRKVAVATRAQASSGDLLATEFELPAFLCHLTRQHTADPVGK